MKNKELFFHMSAAATCTLILQLHFKNMAKDIHKIRKKRTMWSRKWLLRRNQGRGAASLVFEELKIEDPCGFKNFTRMRIQTFELLLTKVGKQLQKQNTNMRECISPNIRLLVTIRFLATGETFQSLSYNFRISVPALSLIVIDCCTVLYKVLREDFLRVPKSNEEWTKIARKFWSLWNFPMCLGALDGKHIAFRAKQSDGSFYYNYKGFHSIILLALVDAEYNFLYVDVGCNGRVSDGGVYANSSLSSLVEQNNLNFPEDDCLPNTDTKVPYVIVADEAFRATRIIMKPWGQRTSTVKKVFNYRLSRARRVVENAFGILSNKFQVLQKDINLCVTKVQQITLTCCALHNFIKQKDGKRYLSGIDVENTTAVTLTEGEWRRNVFMTDLQPNTVNRSVNEAVAIRETFTNYFNEVGRVPWQEEAVKTFNF